jgi:hypothetical protein
MQKTAHKYAIASRQGAHESAPVNMNESLILTLKSDHYHQVTRIILADFFADFFSRKLAKISNW